MRPTISILFTCFLHKYNITDQLSVFILFSSIFVIQLQVSNSREKKMYLFLNICQISRLITRIAVWLTAILKSRCCFIVSKQAMQRKKNYQLRLGLLCHIYSYLFFTGLSCLFFLSLCHLDGQIWDESDESVC